MAYKTVADTSRLDKRQIVSEIENMVNLAEMQRKSFSKRWYDSNFFDDGHHFRFISRTTGRIVDLSDRDTLFAPSRAIPKASRQIRGMANLALSQDFVPKIKPKKIIKANFTNDQDYMAAMERAKVTAKRVGQWLNEEWYNQDFDTKLALLVLLTLKHGVSFMQVWSDPVAEEIKTQVYDAFEIYLVPTVTDINDSPFIGKVIPKTIAEIKANEFFDKDQLEMISIDNRYASDEIKEAYLASKLGASSVISDAAATLLLKEFFIKEYVNEYNLEKIKAQKNAKEILKDRKKGDPVIRHVFTAGKVWLYDKYEDLVRYPFADLRWEPGPIYQVAQIERFIPQNKSLDTLISRGERYTNTMTVGTWLKRKGENFEITNVGGGLVAEYENVPPQQMAQSNLPGSYFKLIDYLTSFIEEQGVTTSALGQLPKGVKAWGAIESLKASEMANFYIPLKMIKHFLTEISEQMIAIADKNFISPKTVYHMDKDSPDYFDVIGQKGLDAHKSTGISLDNVTVLSREHKVEIEIESGLGYTDEGKKGRMLELANFMLSLAQGGFLPQEAIAKVVDRLLEIYKFGPTEELMEALEGFEGQPEMGPAQTQAMKTAMLETLKDFDEANTERDIGKVKVGVAQVAKDLGGQNANTK